MNPLHNRHETPDEHIACEEEMNAEDGDGHDDQEHHGVEEDTLQSLEERQWTRENRQLVARVVAERGQSSKRELVETRHTGSCKRCSFTWCPKRSRRPNSTRGDTRCT